MLFMVIERFRDNDMVPIYQRLRESGRSLPDGLEYVDSWIEPNFARCFQLMRCDDPTLFQEWVLQWRGFGVTFEIVPVVPSKETQAVVARYLPAFADIPRTQVFFADTHDAIGDGAFDVPEDSVDPLERGRQGSL